MAEDKDDLVERLVGKRNRVTRDQIKELVKAARESGGEFLQVSRFGGDDPDDWCGTMWFKKPRPKVGGLIDLLLDRGWVVEVFPYGIPVIDQLRVDIRNQAFGARG